jgi:hypothetical protein
MPTTAPPKAERTGETGDARSFIPVNNAIEADHGRLKSRLRPMRGLKRLTAASPLVMMAWSRSAGWPVRAKPVRSAIPRLDRYPGVRNEATMQADIRQLLLTGESD